MAGDGRGKPTIRNRIDPKESEDELSARLRRLGSELDQGRQVDKEPQSGSGSGSASYAQAFRLSSEFIAGIVVGCVIGWLLDKGLGTSPWGLIVFLLLGFCAGVLNVLRSAGLATEGERPDAGRDKDNG